MTHALFKTQNAGPHLLIQEVRGGAQECAFFVLSCAWVTTMLLTFQGPDFENHCFSEWELIYCYLHLCFTRQWGRGLGSAYKMSGFESQLCHCVVTLERAFRMVPST